jgi:hypothetical protein
MRNSVDLPQPDGPTSTTNSPSPMSTSTPWITSVAPKAFLTSRMATDAMGVPPVGLCGLLGPQALLPWHRAALGAARQPRNWTGLWAQFQLPFGGGL